MAYGIGYRLNSWCSRWLLRFRVDGSCYCYILKHMDKIVYGLDAAGYVTILFHVIELYWESIVRLHSVQLYSSYTRLLLLFTVIIDVYRVYDYCYCYFTALSQYSSNMILIVLTEINNYVNRQLILRLKKLMEVTAFVFWVDLRYRLRNRITVPLQGFGGWLTSHLFIVLQCYCEYCSTVILWVMLLTT